MQPGRVEQGKRWIESEFHTAYEAIHASWHVGHSTQSATLEAVVNGKPRSWTFSYNELCDCRTTPEIQKELRRRLRAL